MKREKIIEIAEKIARERNIPTEIALQIAQAIVEESIIHSERPSLVEKARNVFSLSNEEYEKLQDFIKFIKVLNTRSDRYKFRIYIHDEERTKQKIQERKRKIKEMLEEDDNEMIEVDIDNEDEDYEP